MREFCSPKKEKKILYLRKNIQRASARKFELREKFINIYITRNPTYKKNLFILFIIHYWYMYRNQDWILKFYEYILQFTVILRII